MAARRFDGEHASTMLRAGLTVLQVARELGVSPQAIYRAIKEGRVERPEAAAVKAR